MPVNADIQARNYAHLILNARSILVSEGGQDPVIQEVIQLADSDYQGQIEAAGKAMLESLHTKMVEARQATREAHKARQERANSPEMKAHLNRFHECKNQAASLKEQAVRNQKTRKAKIESLIEQGVSHEAAEAAAGSATSESLLAKAEALLAEAQEIEKIIRGEV